MEKPQDLFGQCPYVTAQRIFSGKWAILIIHHLRGGTLRFGQLQRRLGGITQATLTKQLRELEGYGLIQRRVYAQVPPKVEYSLSPIGEAFLPVLDQFEVFGNRYIAYLNRQGPQGDSCHLNQV